MVISPGHEQFDSTSPMVVECRAFMVGDHQFLSQMLGKEDFDSWWCPLRSLCHADWQDTGHADGFAWTLLKLKEHKLQK